jgi:predicted transport protein
LSDIKLFQLDQNKVTELLSQPAKLEKDLQRLVEQHMFTFLGVNFLASEFTTSNGGRIDSLGLDENGCPVIIEYKRHTNENVINQGLFYYDWLLDHKAEFQLLVMKELGNAAADDIEWDGSRLVCIASDFTKYDEHAIKQIEKNIELMRYKYFGNNLLMLELVNTQSTKSTQSGKINKQTSSQQSSNQDKAHKHSLSISSENILNLYDDICDFCESLGDDSQRKELKLYTAFKRIKNFASFHVLPQKKDERIVMYLKIEPNGITLENGFTHDVTNKGHWGTGNLEVVIRNEQDIEKAKPLIQQSFENN